MAAVDQHESEQLLADGHGPGGWSPMFNVYHLKWWHWIRCAKMLKQLRVFRSPLQVWHNVKSWRYVRSVVQPQHKHNHRQYNKVSFWYTLTYSTRQHSLHCYLLSDTFTTVTRTFKARKKNLSKEKPFFFLCFVVRCLRDSMHFDLLWA